MSYNVMLKSDGKYITVSSETWVAKMNAGDPSISEFLVIEPLDGNRVAIKSFLTNRYLSSTAYRLEFNSTEITPNEVFNMDVRGENAIVLHRGDKHVCPYQDELMLLLNKEAIYTMIPVEEEVYGLMSQQDCCGGTHEEDSGPLQWDDWTHRRQIETALDLFLTKKDRIPNAKRFGSLLDNEYFKLALYNGLYDADHRSPWKGFIYDLHFYDPDKNSSWTSKRPHARKMANALFEEAEKHKSIIEQDMMSRVVPSDERYFLCGYYLGLSLHYLTDLTQPMHAANFTNVTGFNGSEFPWLFDTRHARFEGYVERNLGILFNELKKKDITPELLYADTYLSSDSVILATARYSKKIWNDQLLSVAKQKARDDLEWDAKKIDPILKECFPQGVIWTSRFLLQWIRVRHPQKMAQYTYKAILDRSPTSAESNEWMGQWKMVMGEYQQKGSVRALLLKLALSTEFERKFVRADDHRDTVTTLFKRILCRVPTDSELAYWVNELEANHISYRRIVESLVGSEEYKGLFGEWQPPIGFNMANVVEADPQIAEELLTRSQEIASAEASRLMW